MIFIKIIFFLVFFLTFLVLAFTQKYKMLSKLIVISAFLIGAFFILFPKASDKVANVFGVESGTNLALYMAVMTMMFIVTTLYARIRRHDRLFTQLIRNRAIESVKYKEEQLG
ncbi:DUF2304 domain-containing protein [Vibrio fluvialis]|uniref:DUF2304 domain-containing protein n=1 Tax=Vibrio fluvialis TaxID=676 RepID=UPI0015599CD1|nr:DUF2304 domain-containing protein [Vibrio fluvialis]